MKNIFPMIYIVIFAISAGTIHGSSDSAHYHIAKIPKGDIELNFGLPMLGQIRAAVNLSDLFYVKGRLSSALFVTERGIGAGIQLSGADKSHRAQIGLGYSQIKGGFFTEIDHHTVFLELNIISYFQKRNFRRGFNGGMIFLYRKNGRVSPIINFGWVFAIL